MFVSDGRLTAPVTLGAVIGLTVAMAVPALPARASSRTSCVISDVLAPSCGAWWGASHGQGPITELEEHVGRTYDIVHRWHGVDESRVPTQREIALARDGRYLHLNVEARRFTKSGHPAVQWSEIAGGAFDEALKSQAEGVAQLNRPVFVTFDHEADADDKLGVRGTAAEFVAAWRHIHDVYHSQGAKNAIWVWVVTGYSGNFGKVEGLYPGDAYVDWIAWEAYNASGCRSGSPEPARYESFEEELRPFYEWLQTKGARAGIDPDKPYMITEMGSVVYPDNPQKTAGWYAEIIPTLKKYSQVHAVQMWNSTGQGSCDYRVATHPGILKSYTRAGHQRYVNPP